LKRHRFLSRSDRLDDDVIEPALREELQAIFRRRRQSAGLSARSHAAHEDAVVLRIDHRGAVAEQRPFAHHARIVRQDRDPRPRVALEQTKHQLVNQRGFACSARAGETDNASFADRLLRTRFRFLRALPIGVAIFDLGQFSGELHLRGFSCVPFPRLAIAIMNELHHVGQ
jgi:hypothetical protein